jgi:hypothetical protein
VLGTVLLVGAAALRAKVGLTLRPPHALRSPAATLDAALVRRIDAALADARIEATEDAIAFALAQTGEVLRFGLDHPSRLRFGAEEREAHCVEYAHLFAAVLERAAAARGLRARAWVVHSGQARLFGWAVPLPGFQDHDWVLVVAEEGGQVRSYHVDPTFSDAWLGWDVQRNVIDPPKAPPLGAAPPRRRPPRAR